MNPKRSFETHGVDRPRTFPTPDEVERHLARSRQIRAEAIAAMLRSVGRSIARSVRRLGAPIRHWDRRQQAYQLLMRSSDRVLADIGIARKDIPLIARGIDPPAPEPAKRSIFGRLRAISAFD